MIGINFDSKMRDGKKQAAPLSLRQSRGRSQSSAPAVLLLIIVTTIAVGCASKRQVVIPPDWQTGQMNREQTDRAPDTVIESPRISSDGEIREEDLPAGKSDNGNSTAEKTADTSPQMLASMHLVEQGDSNLQQGALDDAIALYEQAIQIDVYNGDAFYGLARAWYRKHSLNQALEFARKAEIIFQDRPAQLKRVYQLQTKMYEDMDEWGNAARYRAKADRL